MAETNDKYYYFEDTRDDAKNKAPFGVKNADVAKSWKRDYNNGEGPFKPVDVEGSEFQINRRDLQQADLNETPNQVTATEHNMELLNVDGENPYKDMKKKELVEELEARGLDYDTHGPGATNESYIKQLMADDQE